MVPKNRKFFIGHVKSLRHPGEENNPRYWNMMPMPVLLATGRALLGHPAILLSFIQRKMGISFTEHRKEFYSVVTEEISTRITPRKSPT